MAVYQDLQLTQVSQNQIANTSQVKIKWTSRQTGSSYNETRHTAYYYVSVNGAAEKAYSVEYILPLQTTKTIVETTVAVPHNDRGEATVTVRTWMNTNISAGVVEQKQTLTLTTIPRECTVSAADVTIGGSCAIAVDRKNTGFDYTLRLQFGGIQGYLDADGGLSETAVRLKEAKITLPIGEEYYQELTEDTRDIATLTCTTYSGTTQIGSPKTAQFSVMIDPEVCYPSLTASAVDIEQRTNELTYDDSVLISGHSTARITAYPAGKKYATIVSVTVNGQKMTENTLDIPNFSGTSLTVTATDSRGLTTSVKLGNKIIPYTPVTMTAAIQRTDPTSGKAKLTLSGSWYRGSFGDSQNSAVNSLVVQYRIGNGNPQFLIGTVYNEDGTYSLDTVIEGLDYSKTHTVTVTVSDLLTYAERSLTVKKGVPVFDWGENDFRFNVPVSILGEQVYGYLGSYIGQDFNELILVNGYYADTSSPTEAAGCANYPISATGMLIVLSKFNFTYQIYLTYSGRIYFRTHWNNVAGGWNAWKEIQTK